MQTIKFLYLAALLAASLAQQILNKNTQDLTLKAGASGEDVVDACIQKITSVGGVSSRLKNDFGLFKRIALVETNFGTRPGSNNKGGIWQISPRMIASLKAIPSSLKRLYNALKETLGENIVNFDTNDFSLPLRSAVAARIYLEIKLTSFPATVVQQANWWSRHYAFNTNRAKIFKTTIEKFNNGHTVCTLSKLDLWFLIDGSGSVGLPNFRRCLTFVNQTAASFTIAPDRVRTGLMVYSSYTSVRSLFNQHQSNSEFSKVVLSTRYTGGGTATGAAIRATSVIGFNETNGARPSSEAVPRVLIVLTDGQSGDSVIAPSKDIKKMGVTVFGVGVGSGYKASEINEIASDPDSEYAFEFTQFDALKSVLRERVAVQTCAISAVVQDNTSISLSVSKNSTAYSQVQVPKNGSVQLRYQLSGTKSIGIVYLSETISNPSAALHDASFKVKAGETRVYYQYSFSSSQKHGMDKRYNHTVRAILYIALEAQGEDPIKANFSSVASNETAISFAQIGMEITTGTSSPQTTPSKGHTPRAGLLQLSIISMMVLLLIHFK